MPVFVLALFTLGCAATANVSLHWIASIFSVGTGVGGLEGLVVPFDVQCRGSCVYRIECRVSRIAYRVSRTLPCRVVGESLSRCSLLLLVACPPITASQSTEGCHLIVGRLCNKYGVLSISFQTFFERLSRDEARHASTHFKIAD